MDSDTVGCWAVGIAIFVAFVLLVVFAWTTVHGDQVRREHRDLARIEVCRGLENVDHVLLCLKETAP